MKLTVALFVEQVSNGYILTGTIEDEDSSGQLDGRKPSCSVPYGSTSEEFSKLAPACAALEELINAALRKPTGGNDE